MDLKSYSRWYDYSRARDAMFAATDTEWAPWFVARSDDKERARLNIISHLLGSVKYKDVPREKWSCPSGRKRVSIANRTIGTSSSKKSTEIGRCACRSLF